MSYRQSDRRAPDALDGTYSRPSPELSSPDQEAVARSVDPMRDHRVVDDGSQGRGVPTASMKRSGGVSVVAPRTTAVNSGSRVDNVKPANAGPVGATPAPTAPGSAARSSSTSGGVGLQTVGSQVGGVERKIESDRAPAGPFAAGAVSPTTPSPYPDDPAIAGSEALVPRDESATSGAATSPSALVSPSRLGRGSADDERGVKSIPRADVANDDPKNQ